MNAITAEGLVKTFGAGDKAVHAVAGVDLTVPKGQVVGLLGPNGAGKTTIVRMLTTLLRPDAGRAVVAGHDVIAEPQAVRASIGLSGQFAAIDENLTGRENLWLFGRLYQLSSQQAAKRAGELLEQFALTDAADRPAKTYSGGMRRRLDLAAALVHRPPVLFLDEPTTGLDPASRSDLWRVIEELVAEGTTVLLTTQYLEEADRLADHIAVIDHGQVIAEGAPAHLKAGLGGTVVEITVADPAAARRAGAQIGARLGLDAQVEGSTLELAVDDGPQALVEVLRTLDDAGLAIAGLTVREPSLDDVFLSLTGHRTDADAGAGRTADQRGAA